MRDVTALMQILSKSQWLEAEDRQHQNRSKMGIFKKSTVGSAGATRDWFFIISP